MIKLESLKGIITLLNGHKKHIIPIISHWFQGRKHKCLFNWKGKKNNFCQLDNAIMTVASSA